MVGFIVLLFVMIGILAIIIGATDTSNITDNWDKYRCRPTIMPFASFFGHDTSENFQYCMQSIIKDDANFILSPIYQILGTLLGTVGQLMKVANSIRLEFATMMGGVNTIFQNFSDRIMQITTRIRTSVARTRMLMGRLYGTFFALIYISISGVTALQNFGDTILFRFLDTFCFDPDTQVHIKEKGIIPIKNVEIGDVFYDTESRVTSTFSFEADGQPMVEFSSSLGPIKVSTNHYLQHEDKYCRADEHPSSKPIEPWNGGTQRPLICLNTSDHCIPIGEYRFLDYDETEAGDKMTMKWIEKQVNAVYDDSDNINMKDNDVEYDYSTVFDPLTEIRMKDGTTKVVRDIVLGSDTMHGRVIGIVKKEVSQFVLLPTFERVTPGLLIWHYWKSNQWKRAGDLLPVFKMEHPEKEVYYNLIIKGTANIEFASGQVVRDYVEVHSPDSEQFYAKAITSSTPLV